MFKPENILERKSTLFSVVVCMVGFANNYSTHVPRFSFSHIFLHIGGIILAVFIATLALSAYFRLRTKRLLLSAIAFITFIGSQSALLIDGAWPHLYDIGLI